MSIAPEDTRPRPDAPAAAAPALVPAILHTLIYADLFDYPLTAAEIAQYLIGCPAALAEVAAALGTHPTLAAQVARVGEFYCLRGRETVVRLRAARGAASAPLWRRAARYARWLRHFPFVRMLAVTGALAMDNVAAVPDIDLLVIVAPGRVWICRRLLICAVRAIRLLGDEICPNFILAADELAIAQRDLFTAHELAQMRPAAGYAVYRAMLAANPWLAAYLPNARPWPLLPALAPDPPRRPWLQRAAERLLRAPLLDRWERAELARLRRHLGTPADDEVVCTPGQCKGHTGHYRRRVLARYEARVTSEF